MSWPRVRVWGGAQDGTLRQYGVFSEHGLVRKPAKLTFTEASTLTCAGLTAWNALYGSASPIQAGDWVLVQGSGGVSVFELQLAIAAGARVVGLSGSADKAATLQKLGAEHVINYKETAEWGVRAKELRGGRGFEHIVEVVGPASMQQSLNAVAMAGTITIVGFVGGFGAKMPDWLQILTTPCTVRGILVGSRDQMEEIVRAVEANPDALRPCVDANAFSLD